jgi:ubiquinone/menaquinone biosynthesis C-methylase UbiE
MASQHLAENLWTVRLLDVQPSDRILEIGFGPGVAIQEVARQLGDGVICGADISMAMVRAARRRNRKAVRAGRVDLRQGGFDKLPFGDGLFDKVYTINTVYFWMKPEQVLAEARRVMKAGGMLVVTFMPAERWNPALGTPVETETFKPYAGEAVREMVAGAGFVDVRIETDDHPEQRANYSVVGVKR